VRSELPEAEVIPVSALEGDNVVERSDRMPWYDGPSLLEWLERLPVAADRNLDDLRFPVQWVIRPQSPEHHDYRGYAGQLASGMVKPGDEVAVLPGGRTTHVASIDTADGELDEAFPPLSVALRLEDDMDLSRGDMVVGAGAAPEALRELEATLCWMGDRPLVEGSRYRLKHTTRSVSAKVDAVEGKLDVHTLGEKPAPDGLGLNDLGRVRLKLGQPIFADSYEANRVTGSFILVDESSNETVGAGMVS
jgi:sulfate adenylyltransferase subunit 1 (EFTu-like GTPase family)